MSRPCCHWENYFTEKNAKNQIRCLLVSLSLRVSSPFISYWWLQTRSLSPPPGYKNLDFPIWSLQHKWLANYHGKQWRGWWGHLPTFSLFPLGFLTCHQITFPRTHKLTKLCLKCDNKSYIIKHLPVTIWPYPPLDVSIIFYLYPTIFHSFT